MWRQRWLLKRDRRNFLGRNGKRGPGGLDPSRVVGVNEHTRGSVKITSDRKLVLELPARLDFEEFYEVTASHFGLLRQATQGLRQVRTLRFNDIRYIFPVGGAGAGE